MDARNTDFACGRHFQESIRSWYPADPFRPRSNIGWSIQSRLRGVRPRADRLRTGELVPCRPSGCSRFCLPLYLRAEAYLDAKEGAAADVEFQKIIQHRGIIGNSPLAALAHLGGGL